ncbi:hypothetical protein HDU86_002928, partial [Geranomyces michiganensis]
MASNRKMEKSIEVILLRLDQSVKISTGLQKQIAAAANARATNPTCSDYVDAADTIMRGLVKSSALTESKAKPGPFANAVRSQISKAYSNAKSNMMKKIKGLSRNAPLPDFTS